EFFSECVNCIMVKPFRFYPRHSSMVSSPCLEFKFPVGSSASNSVRLNEAFQELFQLSHLGNISAMDKRHPDLFQKTMELEVGQHQIETAHSSKGKIMLLIQSSVFDIKEGGFRIVVYQNINEAIDETETRAWHKLLRVLTHEITNSIGPISSLAETLHDRL